MCAAQSPKRIKYAIWPFFPIPEGDRAERTAFTIRSCSSSSSIEIHHSEDENEHEDDWD